MKAILNVGRRAYIKFGWMSFVLVLLALIMAEGLILMSVNDLGWLRVFSPFAHLGSAWGWTYGYVGPVIIPLSALTAVYLYVTWCLVLSGLGLKTIENRSGYFRALTIVEYAQAWGFLGTTLALVGVMQNLNPSLGQVALVQSMMNESAKAFGSTIVGIVLSAMAYITRQIFGITESGR